MLAPRRGEPIDYHRFFPHNIFYPNQPSGNFHVNSLFVLFYYFDLLKKSILYIGLDEISKNRLKEICL